MCEKEYISTKTNERPGATQEEQIAMLRRWLATFESGERIITSMAYTVSEVRTGAPGSGKGEFTPDGVQVWEIRHEPKDGPVVFSKV